MKHKVLSYIQLHIQTHEAASQNVQLSRQLSSEGHARLEAILAASIPVHSDAAAAAAAAVDDDDTKVDTDTTVGNDTKVETNTKVSSTMGSGCFKQNKVADKVDPRCILFRRVRVSNSACMIYKPS